MKLSFVSVQATDKVVLPALLYEPEQKTKQAALWLHAMGDSGVFYKPELMNALGQALSAKGIAFLALNNRGAHSAKRLKIADESLPEDDRSYPGGTHYEVIADCVKDIDGAASFLTTAGFSYLYLLGHSTGANKICVYHAARQNNKFTKYVLAGPGDDVGIFFQDLGANRFWQALKYAAKKLPDEPLRLMPKYSGMYPFSVQSTWDILNPDGNYNTFPYSEATTERLGQKPLFKEYRTIDRPCLVIVGEDDEYLKPVGGAQAALDLFMKHTSNVMLKTTDFLTVQDADHSFHKREAAFAKTVSDWLAYD